MTTVEQAQQALEYLAPRLEEEGYTVYLKPPRRLLPKFMQDYAPDAIALGKQKNLAIDVYVEGGAPRVDEKEVSQLFRDAPGWDRKIYYFSPVGAQDTLPVGSAQEIESALAEIRGLMSAGHSRAALLMGWAAFETLGRMLHPLKFSKAQSPGRLIEVLASDGYVTPSEADRLRVLAKDRNKVIHGDLRQNIEPKNLIALIEVLEILQGLATEPATPVQTERALRE